jgi:ubiquinone/menaquinone biosynthesis C-methylase UbiE
MNANDEKKIRDTVNFYDGFSEKYDLKYAAYLHHTHNRLLTQIGNVSGERILDISCGTGLLAEHLLNRFTEVNFVLNDPSDGMRAIAENRFKGKASVEFAGTFAEEIDFEKESFDRVICLNSFHYYADQKKVVENISDVLKPGGSVHILDWNLEGWFHLSNSIISILSPENINTRSLSETENIFDQQGFSTTYRDKWSFRFWKFYLIEAKK